MARLRAAVAAHIRATSRRETARAIGLTPRGLGKFVEGTTPHPATVDKLVRWYRETFTDGAGGASRKALRVLVEPLPPERWAEAETELRLLLKRLYAESGTPLPPELQVPDAE